MQPMLIFKDSFWVKCMQLQCRQMCLYVLVFNASLAKSYKVWNCNITFIKFVQKNNVICTIAKKPEFQHFYAHILLGWRRLESKVPKRISFVLDLQKKSIKTFKMGRKYKTNLNLPVVASSDSISFKFRKQLCSCS